VTQDKRSFGQIDIFFLSM